MTIVQRRSELSPFRRRLPLTRLLHDIIEHGDIALDDGLLTETAPKLVPSRLNQTLCQVGVSHLVDIEQQAVDTIIHQPSGPDGARRDERNLLGPTFHHHIPERLDPRREYADISGGKKIGDVGAPPQEMNTFRENGSA